jgi:uncharacterized protein YodC (DUF2158 family)
MTERSVVDDEVAAQAATLLGWNSPIEIGDVVYLKSGSVAMTALSIDAGTVQCCWFDKAKSRREDFPEFALTKQSTSPDGRTRGVVIIGDLTPGTEKH